MSVRMPSRILLSFYRRAALSETAEVFINTIKSINPSASCIGESCFSKSSSLAPSFALSLPRVLTALGRLHACRLPAVDKLGSLLYIAWEGKAFQLFIFSMKWVLNE